MEMPRYDYKLEDLEWIPAFMADVKDYFFARPEDNLLILRPNKVMHLNRTGMLMLKMLLDGATPAEVVDFFVGQGADRQTVLNDIAAFVNDLREMVSGNQNIYTYRTAKIVPFGTGEIKYPVLSEIALTYRCNNRCRFCYAYSPYRKSGEMTTEEVKRVIDVIADDAHVPSLSFTGGEPTLRDDLFELIEYGRKKGLRMNLITNGRRCADKRFVDRLVDAGLNSAQVSIEGPDAETHDYIVGVPGAFEQTVKGIKNLRETDIYTHCNTTICKPNVDKLEQLVDFHKDELGLTYFSMNMVIYTGTAAKLRDELQIRYSEIGEIVKRVRRRARKKGIQFVWYAPTPVCLFNPIQYGLGAKTCACCDGLLSVDAEGKLLPCSSFSEPVGDLLHDGFEKVWYNRAARFWRNKDYAPEGCKRCDMFDYCMGACPLYWDVHGFDEIKQFWPERSAVAAKIDGFRLTLRRRIRGDQHGIT
ncbi:MAG: radical SAM protein [Candidatus Thorarchaeota archaeon]|nr:MAG: radical SAM protein [Candidatus Thorarchaeota archaeon]RLI61486.1 MAG: radical SAM protein [Candidatus Thorarchaeota archaeon]